MRIYPQMFEDYWNNPHRKRVDCQQAEEESRKEGAFHAFEMGKKIGNANSRKKYDPDFIPLPSAEDIRRKQRARRISQ